MRRRVERLDGARRGVERELQHGENQSIGDRPELLPQAVCDCGTVGRAGSRLVDPPPVGVDERGGIQLPRLLRRPELFVELRAFGGVQGRGGQVSEPAFGLREVLARTGGRERHVLCERVGACTLEQSTGSLEASEAKESESEEEVRTLEVWNPAAAGR